MTSYSEINDAKSILVFLPRAAAQVIVSKLVQNGYMATAVDSVPELFDALRSGVYSLAVTTRPDIDMVRNIQSIPVVNLEVFFHILGSTGDSVTASKQFDGKAFLDRVRALHEPRAAREESVQGNPTDNSPATLMLRRMPQWWAKAKIYLGNRMLAAAEK